MSHQHSPKLPPLEESSHPSPTAESGVRHDEASQHKTNTALPANQTLCIDEKASDATSTASDLAHPAAFLVGSAAPQAPAQGGRLSHSDGSAIAQEALGEAHSSPAELAAAAAAAAAAATEDVVQETVDAILAAGEEQPHPASSLHAKAEEEPERGGGGGDAKLASVAVAAARDRASHVFIDDNGTEKTFGSALGLLTRKFIHLIQSSYSGAVDMNESAVTLQVPKRRIYDITNVLEGVGLLEKRSKNTVAWKGSELILGSAMDADAKLRLEQLRRTLTDLHQEEALLEQWVLHLSKLPVSGTPIHLDDVLLALFPQASDDGTETRAILVDEATGKPRRALLAVHAPKESVACIPAPSDPSLPERQLYVGTRVGLDHKFPPKPDVEDPLLSTAPTSTSSLSEPSNKKRRKLVALSSYAAAAASSRRKAPGSGSAATKQSSPIDHRLHVFVVPTYYDESECRLKSTGLRSLIDPASPNPPASSPPAPPTGAADASAAVAAAGMDHPVVDAGDEAAVSTSKRSASWDVAESLAHDDEGVAAFLEEAASADDPGTRIHPSVV